jgi:hypothetical protein
VSQIPVTHSFFDRRSESWQGVRLRTKSPVVLQGDEDQYS